MSEMVPVNIAPSLLYRVSASGANTTAKLTVFCIYSFTILVQSKEHR